MVIHREKPPQLAVNKEYFNNRNSMPIGSIFQSVSLKKNVFNFN